MMRGLAMPSGGIAARIVEGAFARGLVIETSGPDDEVVKCLAALTIDEAELRRGLDILGTPSRARLGSSAQRAELPCGARTPLSKRGAREDMIIRDLETAEHTRRKVESHG